MDVDDIAPGADFVSLIEQKVASSDALIAVIGKNWLMRDRESGLSQFNDPGDFVRLEVEHALRRDILLIPALVEGTHMPRAEDLPVVLTEFAQRQAVELSDKDFQRGVDKIIVELEKLPVLRSRSRNRETHQTARPPTRGRSFSWGASIALLFVMLFLAWQWRAGKGIEPVHPPVEAFAGGWQANVTYGWGDSYKERFKFQTEDNRLVGTASFLGHAKGIEDGKIDGDKISFSVRFQEMLGATTAAHKNSYTGKMTGSEIQFRMQDDRGNPPVEFTARKIE